MKKIFTLMLMAVLAIVANAQMLKFQPFTAGNNPKMWSIDGLFVYIIDDNNKMSVVEGKRRFSDGEYFETRLKTTGHSYRKNQIFVDVKSKGTLTLYVSSANSQQMRLFFVTKGADLIYRDSVQNLNKRPVVIKVENPGEFQLQYPDGPVNIYGIKFEPEGAAIKEQ